MVKRLLHRVPLRTLKRWFKWKREIGKVVTGAGIRAFISAAVVSGFVFSLAVWGIIELKHRLESRIARTFLESVPSATGPREEGEPVGVPSMKLSPPSPTLSDYPSPPKPRDEFIDVSFNDLFSGVGWINQDLTTMYQDRTVTAFMFPPRFEWNRGGSGVFIDDDPNRACVGDRCLELREGGLRFDHVPLPLPQSVAAKHIVRLSVSTIGDRWFVGAVTREGETYEAYAFLWDGSRYTDPFQGPAFHSPYEGVVAAGGDENDFLVIYGAYEGQAFRVRGGIENCKLKIENCLTNLSHLFGIRVMNGGFHPVVLHLRNNQSSPAITSWYVWSATEGNPKLVKLFEDSSGEIGGAVDFSPLIFSSEVRRASFSVAGRARLLAELLLSSGTREGWEFIDQEFDTLMRREVVSVSVNGTGAAVRSASVSEVEPASVGAGAHFFLSNDGVTWVPAAVGDKIEFSNPNGRQLLWRAVFAPDSFLGTPTPFFNRVRLDYQVQFL